MLLMWNPELAGYRKINPNSAAVITLLQLQKKIFNMSVSEDRMLQMTTLTNLYPPLCLVNMVGLMFYQHKTGSHEG